MGYPRGGATPSMGLPATSAVVTSTGARWSIGAARSIAGPSPPEGASTVPPSSEPGFVQVDERAHVFAGVHSPLWEAQARQSLLPSTCFSIQAASQRHESGPQLQAIKHWATPAQAPENTNLHASGERLS
jgi:hypothetical protein